MIFRLNRSFAHIDVTHLRGYGIEDPAAGAIPLTIALRSRDSRPDLHMTVLNRTTTDAQ